MKTASILLSVPLLVLPLSGAQAQRLQSVGSTVAVINMVTAEFNRDTRTLQRGDRVHQNETIEVSSDASSELKLDDDTKLALGPGSHLTLDEFVYNPDKANGSIVLDLVKGTFRFITGVAEKPTYVIKTPAAAITVRGTIFDVFVQNKGPTWILLHEGAVQVRTAKGACKDLYEPGKLIRIDNDGAVGPPVRWASLPGKDSVQFNDAFPFVEKTPSIDPDPVLTRDVIMTGALPAGSPKGETCDGKSEEIEPVPAPNKAAPRKAKPTYDEPPPKIQKIKKREKYREEKPKKQAKKHSDDDNIVSGMDIVIGGGLAIGRMKNKHKGGGEYGGSMGGMGRPGGMGGSGGYGGKMPH